MSHFENNLASAKKLDSEDVLKEFRDKLYIPIIHGRESIDFTGNSLGLQPKTAQEYILNDLEDWANYGVEGHFHGRNPWIKYHEMFPEKLASIFQKSNSQPEKANAVNILPDIKVGQAYASSGSRNKELSNLRDQIPYTDPDNKFIISYNRETKDITVTIPQAANLSDYRDKKHLAEFKLEELGANDLCLLLILWAPPPSLKSQLSSKDGITTGCNH